MKITVFFLFITFSTGFAKSSYSQNTRLSLHLENATIQQIFDEIQKKSEFIIFYKDDQVDINHPSSVDIDDATVDQILDQALKGTDLGYKIIDRQIVISTDKIKDLPSATKDSPSTTMTETSVEQKKEISGKVKDSKGLSLPGVAVIIKESTIGTITDSEGQFRLTIPADAKTLVFSFVGMKSQEVVITGNTPVNIVMEEETIGLEDVVVVGYGVQKKATVTGAVTSIESTRLMQSPVSNLSNAIVGRVSGLLTAQGSGAPGMDQSTLRIRGIGTFAGSAEPLIMVDGIETQNYNNIDPNEIENISVLKDASATAVYGVRGANGVLIITTKRGKLGKPQVSFTSQFAVSQFADERHYAPSDVWADGFNKALQFDSYITGAYIPKFSDTDIQHYKNQDDPLFYPNTNWVDLMFKPYATQSQYNLNISGGTEKVKYFVSAGYFKQGSLFNEDTYDPGYDASVKYNRYNFRSNFDFFITKRLTAKVNFSSQIDDLRGVIVGSQVGNYATQQQPAAFSSILTSTYMTPPNISPGVWDGKIVTLQTVPSGFYKNPLLGRYDNPWQRGYNNYLNGTVRFDYSLDFILQGLSTHATVAYQNKNGVQTSLRKNLVEYLVIKLPGDTYQLVPQSSESQFVYSQSTSANRKQDAEIGLDYNRVFGNHSFTGLLLYNQSKEYPGPSLSIPRGYQGMVGRVTYDYKKRYLAEFNFGYNGTENFAEGKRFGFFPAYSLGWVVSEEPFFPENKIVSFLKLRGSYGEVGNDRIGSDRFLYNKSSYTYPTDVFFKYSFGMTGVNLNTYTSSAEGKIGNPELTWERAKKLDIGLDLRMLNDKVKITLDYFDERRDNILANLGTVPVIVGATLPAYNLGKMKNGGLDGEVTYNGKAGNLNYWLRGNFTFTHNIIQFMDEVKRSDPYLQQTGLRYGQSFGLVVEGIYNSWEEVNDANRPVSSYNNNRIQPGDFRYKDVNGDAIINANDMVPIGYSGFPEKSFGFSFGGDFKGFDISVLFNGATNYSHSASGRAFARGWSNEGSAISYLFERSWTQEKYLAGIATDFPHFSSSNSQTGNYQSNTFWNGDASYLRLKNIEFGYTLTAGLLKRAGIGPVRLYVNGQNLMTWDKLFPGEDPEIPNYNDSTYDPYPITMTINGGINVKF